MVRIAVLASFNMDLVMRAERSPLPGETLQGDFAMHLGGKGFNQAIAARRLGADVTVVGRVGDDEFGRLFLQALDREGIDARGVAIDREHGTGVAVITVTPDGENAIIQSPRANRALSAADVDAMRPTIATADAALLQLETSDEAALAFARAAPPPTIFNAAPARTVSREMLAACDMLVVNEIEARTVAGSDSARTHADLLQALVAAGARSVVLTLGAKGATSLTGGRVEHTPAPAIEAVDTTGAGDAFCAALAVRLAEGADLADAVRFACAAGAVACTRHGAEPSMPQRHEVEALLKREGYG
jgi:ribokinase